MDIGDKVYIKGADIAFREELLRRGEGFRRAIDENQSRVEGMRLQQESSGVIIEEILKDEVYLVSTEGVLMLACITELEFINSPPPAADLSRIMEWI